MKNLLANLLPMLAADAADWSELQKTFTGLIDSMFTPLVAVASALAVIWGVYLGIKWWRSAGDEGKRKEAKNAVISFVVGVIVIFLVAVGAPLLIAALVDWRGSI